MTTEIVFRAKGLTKVYRNGALEVHALRGIDFQARKGEFVVILGPSGSGKSTFLNIVGGLDTATAGEAWFEDHQLTALTEKGELVNGRGDTPNKHDILTGSRTDGTAFGPGDPDMTCGNWTRSGAEGAVVVGHHDRTGLTPDPWSLSWNSSHQSRGGCSQTALKGTGGDGLFYCFAAK